jgi:hypothetical protein
METNYNKAYNFVKKNYSKVGFWISDCKKMGKLLVDLHLRLAQNRAKQKRLDKRLLLRGKER